MKKRDKILIVDDAEINCSMLTDMLSDEYEILEASNGLEAVAVLKKQHSSISLVLLDIVMPKMDGLEVLAAMNKNDWIRNIPVIMISAEKSPMLVDHAYDLGAVEFINRPFDPKTVNRRVKNTIMLYSKQKQLESMVTEQLLQKEKSNLIMVEILSHIVEFRNGESGLHVLHIRIVTELLLKQLAKITDKYDLNPSRISMIVNAAALHDIGKISVPEHILNKPGKLTAEEYEIVKTHSAIGAQMLEGIPYYQSETLVREARDICRWHHERFDGKGYPDGLAGEKIPISAQAVALADVYDALISERVYKTAYTHEEALRMILDGECGSFNPLLLRCLEETSPRLAEELGIRSTGKMSKRELRLVTRNMLDSGNVSNRTLALLEQERTKYQFFASMSKEIQFEYSYQSDILNISEWGAEHLGISEIIMHPIDNKEFFEVFSKEDYLNLRNTLKTATPESPIVQHIYALNIHGQRRLHKFVVRPLWVEDDGRELTGVIGKVTDEHEQLMEFKRLQQQAVHDYLTNLYNRDFAKREIEKTLRGGLEKNKKFALLLFDLDYFKTANDRFGHVFGDSVLKEVASKIKDAVRNADVLAARAGGDEFLLFLEYKDEVEEFVRDFYRDMCGHYRGFEIAISIGVALAPKDAKEYDKLFHCADQALYAAKQNGRNRYCFYDESMKGLLSVLSPVDKKLD